MEKGRLEMGKMPGSLLRLELLGVEERARYCLASQMSRRFQTPTV